MTHSTATGSRTPWTATSYPFTSPARKGGPAKLADSGVAPLVAQARGYALVTQKEEAKALAAKQRASEGLIRTGRALEALLHGGNEDLLVMPWFEPASVLEDGLAAREAELQYRPSAPKANEAGKLAKYAFLPGAQLTLDLHPATPASWIEDAPQVLLNEGLLKGDSALTALLLEFGTTADELAFVSDPETARARISELMDRVPRALRTLVVNAASVTGWDRPKQWKAIPLRGRRFVVAFDGDLATNANVWRESEKARAFALRATGQEATLLETWKVEVELAKIAAGFDPDDKLGVDDYLTRIGGWQDLLDLQTVNVPPSPAEERHAKVGDWRVNPNCPAIVEEFVERTTADGKSRFWEERSRVGARIERFIEQRMPLPEEIEAGVRADVAGVVSTQMVEMTFHTLGKWDEPGIDEPTTHTVTVPAATLAASGSSDWKQLIDRGQLHLPAEVLTHPDFPPRNVREWLGAVKDASAPHIAVAWGRQGWVAGAADERTEPFGAFVIGDRVIAETPEQEASIVQGVSRQQSPNLGKFGVEDRFHDLGRDAWDRQLAAEVPETIAAFMGAFRDPQSAAILLCAALAPSTPIRWGGTNVFLNAPKGHGKSHAASIPLSFWGARNRSWDRKSLTGTGSDTRPMVEQAIGRHVMWVIDDLAPSADAQKAAGREDAIGDVLRTNFNGKSRSRTGAEAVPDPYAVVLVTAENLPAVASVRDRTWEVTVPKGGLLTDAGYRIIEELRDSGALRRLGGYAIRSWTNGVHADDHPRWEDRMEACGAVDEVFDLLEDRFEDAIRARQPHVEVDLAPYARDIERAVAIYRGVWHFFSQLQDSLRRSGHSEAEAGTHHAVVALAETIPASLAAHAVASREVMATLTPARQTLKAIAALLSSGKAHLVNPTTPSAPPVVDDLEKVAAGWQPVPMGGWRPMGASIGFLGTTAKGEQIVILDSTAAFTAASAAYPALIPGGSTADAAWTSLTQEPELLPTGTKVEKSPRLYLGDPGATTETRRSLKGPAVKWDALQDLR